MVQTNTVIENLFRTEYGKIIAVLTNKFGPSLIEAIEDAVQDALLKAMQVWGYKDLPENPTSWLIRVANNSLIDKLRRDKKMVVGHEQTGDGTGTNPTEMSFGNTISDSQLKMAFACCHPVLSTEYQIILSLKLMGGFSNKEIAKALIKKEETVAKSFTRAKKKLKEEIKTLDIPVEIGLQSRLFVVLKVLYLLFSEGYAATSGKSIIKKDICSEAIRLALLLQENKYCRHLSLGALIALMCFHASRFEARLNQNLEIVDLEHQDRSLYNKELIRIGIYHLENSGTLDQNRSNYHLEAAVSYYHCVAKTFEETDWENILRLYDLQLQRQYSPIVELNRIVPYYMVKGSRDAMEILQKLRQGPHFKENTLYYAIEGELFSNLDKREEAISSLSKAISFSNNELEKKHFAKKVKILKNS